MIGDVTGLIANLRTGKPYRRTIFSPDPIGWPRESGEGWNFWYGQVALKEMEQEKHSAVESVQKQLEEQLAKAEQDHQHAIGALEKNYTAQIAQLQEKNAEIKALGKKVTEEAQQAADRLAQEQQAHQKTLSLPKTRIC